MKIFISWSGERSKQLAEAIRWWLPHVLQSTKPYFTPSGIEKGKRWSNDISKELEQPKIGLIAMTEENLTNPWIMFEAGAISKVVEEGLVYPIVFKRAEVRQLLTTINNAAEETTLNERHLEEAFSMWWPELEKKVAAISSAVQLPSEPHRKDSDLLRENLELTRSLVTEHQRLIEALRPFHGTFTDPQSVVRALLRREVKLERSLRTSGVDKAEMEGFVAALTDSLTAKSE
jgi:hypothetical protein